MFKVRLTIITKTGTEGVSFYAMNAATVYNLDAMVKSQNGNSIVIEAEGKKDQINEFVNWCNNNELNTKITDYSLSYKPGSRLSRLLNV